MRAAKVQASLRIRAVSPEPSLLAHTSNESRGTFRQKARSLAPLNGWACAVEICHDEILEDTNSLDAAQLIYFYCTHRYSCFVSLQITIFNFILTLTVVLIYQHDTASLFFYRSLRSTITNKAVISNMKQSTMSRSHFSRRNSIFSFYANMFLINHCP